MQSLDIGLFLAVFANLATATAEVRRFRACVPVINYAAVAGRGAAPYRTLCWDTGLDRSREFGMTDKGN